MSAYDLFLEQINNFFEINLLSDAAIRGGNFVGAGPAVFYGGRFDPSVSLYSVIDSYARSVNGYWIETTPSGALLKESVDKLPAALNDLKTSIETSVELSGIERNALLASVNAIDDTVIDSKVRAKWDVASLEMAAHAEGHIFVITGDLAGNPSILI
jgi:hypothetical protein